MDRGHHHRGRTLAVAVLLAFAAALVLARPAHAGSYVVTECSSVSAVAPDATWEALERALRRPRTVRDR